MKKINYVILLIIAITCSFYAPANAMIEEKKVTPLVSPEPEKQFPYKLLTKDQKKETQEKKDKEWKDLQNLDTLSELDEKQQKTLYVGLFTKNESELIELIKKIDPNYKFTKLSDPYDKYNTYIIYAIIASPYPNLLRELMKKNPDLNVKNHEYLTPLQYAFKIEESCLPQYKAGTLECLDIIIEQYVKIIKNQGYKTLHKNGDMINALDLRILFDLQEHEKTALKFYKKALEVIDIIIDQYAKIMQKQGYTTLYKDGSMANALDLCILFDLHEYEKMEIESDKQDRKIPITNDLTAAIKSGEAIIVSRSLMINLSLLSKKEDLYKKVVDTLLCNNNWSIFVEEDHDIFVLIPHSKYPLIEKTDDLETIGLNSKILTQKLNFTEIILDKDSQKKLDELTKDKPIFSFSLSLKLKTLFLVKIISQGKDILPKIENLGTLDVRVVLSGHGSEETLSEETILLKSATYRKDSIAGLSFDEYRNLRDVMNNVGCSFFYINTCKGGETIFMSQTLNLQRTKPEPLPGPLSSKNFIEVAIGIPGSCTHATFDLKNFSQIFVDLNKFFEDQKKVVIAEIKLKKKLNKKEVKYLSKNLTEQQILAGEKLKLKLSPSKTISFDLNPILKRKPEIKKSPDFIKVLQDLTKKCAENIPRVRFPGDTQMAPLKEVFPDLITEAKNLLNKILEEKRKDLKTNEKILPIYKKSEHSRTLLLEQSIDRLKIEIYDIEEYLRQLDGK